MGFTIDEIVVFLRSKPEIKISHGTVCRDLAAKQEEVQDAFKSYIGDELPRQHHLAVIGLQKVLKEAWRLYINNPHDPRLQLAALHVVTETIMRKQAVLGDPAQIEKAILAAARLKNHLPAAQEPER